MSETAISLKTKQNERLQIKAMQEEAEKNEQNFEFVCENDGFRYYKDVKTGRQCCLDSAGFWYILNEEKGAFEPMASNFVAEKLAEKPRRKQDKMQSMLKNVERFGIRFDQHGKPVFPKNEKGHFILPKDEKGSPFFPVDDRTVPIFPWDHEKGIPTFPVDDTDEPIFPRNDQNKPIVPVDENDQPIFPVDKMGTFIFPVDESNCPIPALTVYGTRVVPKDEFGNAVIPRDRDGKALIHIASDGVTPLSMGEWKQWKKYYKEQAQVRNFYQQRQQQPVAVEPAAAAGVGIGAVNYSAMNSMFHPLNLEQQSAYFAADMEMLQRVRRVRPEDVDLPGQMVGQNSTTDQNAKQTANGQTSLEDREEKRKKLLKAQLKSAKMVVPPAPQIPKKIAEEHKKNGTQPQKEESKKDIGKKKQPQMAERRESSGESGKRGRGSGMSRESSKRAQGNSRKRGRERSRESSGDKGRKTMRRSSRSRSVKRRRRDSSSSSYSSTSRSRSRSRSYRRSPKRSPARDRRRDRTRRSTSNSSRSSSSSSASSSSQYSSSERSHSQSRSFTSDRDEEEERIRDRIIARTLSTSVTAAPAKQPQSKDDGVAMDEAMEYGPKPPESLEVSILNSDMEMSEEEEDEKEQNQQRENELPKVNQRTSLKREPSVELLNNVPEEGGKEHEKASPPKKAETQEVVAERGIVFSALEAQPQDVVVVVVEHAMASPPKKVQPQSVVASTTNTQQTEKVTTTHRQSIFNVEEALVSGDIELIKQCKEKERERYDQLKLQISELVMKKSVHKWNWTQLREAEKRILGRHTERTLSESSEDEAK